MTNKNKPGRTILEEGTVRKRVSTLLFFLFILVVIYASLEIFVRLYVLNKGFSYIQIKPDSFPHFSLLENYKDDEVTINQGRREQFPRAERSFKIAFVGDSETFGIGMNDRFVFTKILEDSQNWFNANNFGVPGYGLLEVGVSIKSILQKKKHQLIVYTFNVNDLFPTMAGTLSLLLKPETRFTTLEEFSGTGGTLKLFIKDHLKAIPAIPFLLQSGFNYFFPSPVSKIQASYDSRLFDLASSPKYRKFYGIVKKMYQDKEIQNRLSLFFRSLMKNINEQGSSLIIILHHDLYFLVNSDSGVRDSLSSILSDLKIDYLDLFPLYAAHYKKCGFFHDTTHLGKLGHQFLAKAILTKLNNHKLKPNLPTSFTPPFILDSSCDSGSTLSSKKGENERPSSFCLSAMRPALFQMGW